MHLWWLLNSPNERFESSKSEPKVALIVVAVSVVNGRGVANICTTIATTLTTDNNCNNNK